MAHFVFRGEYGSQVDQAASAERTNLLRSEREYQRERARARAQNEDKTALRDFLLRASEPNRSRGEHARLNAGNRANSLGFEICIGFSY